MARYLALFALPAFLVPVTAYGLYLVLPDFPRYLLGAVLMFCPSYLFFLATAGCHPLDACSMETLAWVVGTNLLLYLVIGSALWFTRERYRFARVFILVPVVAAWVWIWRWV